MERTKKVSVGMWKICQKKNLTRMEKRAYRAQTVQRLGPNIQNIAYMRYR